MTDKSVDHDNAAWQASTLGNASANTAAAEALEHLHLPHEALRFWSKAARAGHAHAQVPLAPAGPSGSTFQRPVLHVQHAERPLYPVHVLPLS